MDNEEVIKFPKEKSYIWLITQHKEVLIKDHNKRKKNLDLNDVTLCGLNQDILIGNIAKYWRIFCAPEDLALISVIHTPELKCKTYILRITLNNEHRKLIQSSYSCNFIPYRSLIDEVTFKYFNDKLKESFILLLEYLDRDDY